MLRGESSAEIAAAPDCSPAAVHNLLQRAKHTLAVRACDRIPSPWALPWRHIGTSSRRAPSQTRHMWPRQHPPHQGCRDRALQLARERSAGLGRDTDQAQLRDGVECSLAYAGLDLALLRLGQSRVGFR